MVIRMFHYICHINIYRYYKINELRDIYILNEINSASYFLDRNMSKLENKKYNKKFFTYSCKHIVHIV